MPVTMIKSDARAREKPCLRCGYSLRKLLDSKHCPECGLSVWLSLNPNDTLDWSNPEWLKRLSLATWVLAAAQATAFVPYALWGMSLFLDPRWIYPALLTAGFYLIAYHVGLLMLSVYEGRHPDRWKTFRWSCRAVAVVGMLIGAMLALHGTGATPRLGAEYTLKAALVASAISTWAYLRKLAQRIPQSTLARLSAYLMFLPLIPLLALLKFVPFFAIFAVLEIWNLLDFLPIAYIPFTVILFVWYARLFRKSVIAAEHGWNYETASPGTPTNV